MNKPDRSYPRPKMLDQGPSFYDRDPPRSPCAITCRLTVDGVEREAVLEDFSFHGCKISCGRGVIVGSTIAVHLPDCEPVLAFVKWSIGGKAGCVFRPRLDEVKMKAALGAAERLEDCD